MQYLDQIITWGGSALSAVVSAITVILIAVSKIRKARLSLEETTRDYGQQSDKLADTADKMLAISGKVQEVVAAYNAQKAELEALRAANEGLQRDNRDLKVALVLIAGGTPALVTNGTANEVRSILEAEAHPVAIDEVTYEEIQD